MQLNFYANTIDQQLSRAIHSIEQNRSEFQWYLALQVADISQYNIENEDVAEYGKAYSSIKLPSAPKASFYAEPSHYNQYARQAEAIQQTKQPALHILLTNCLYPHSLHWSNDEQMFSDDIIENCPLHAQREHFPQHSNDKHQVLQTGSQYEEQQSPNWSATTHDNNLQSELSAMPADFFVDTTLENLAQALNMDF